MGNCVSPQTQCQQPRNAYNPNQSNPSPKNSSQILVKPPFEGLLRSQQTQSTPKQYHVNVSNGYQPESSNPEPNTRLIALYRYESRADGDLSLEKGEIMVLMDEKNDDWWYVLKEKDGKTGYVPRNFVAVLKTLESEEWFAGKISRSQAERQVSRSNFPIGTFLIREREVEPLEYALTIRDESGVKHYKIKRLDYNGFFITAKIKFSSLQDLVHYYSKRSDGLCSTLVFPAPKIAPSRKELSRDTQENWEIPRDQLELKEKLGDGNFGEVWKGKWRGIVDVAIKTMKTGTMSSDAFIQEAQIMKHCDHPNLVKLYAVCTRQEPFYIITEFMEGGSLLSFLRDERNLISEQAMIDMSGQIANGMKYLEERKLVHRDLAARNVLVGERISGVPVVKIADFGLARKLLEENCYEAQPGGKFPIKWTSPESSSSGNFTVKSDVWSFGILLCEIFSRGLVPYPGMSNREVIETVAGGYRMPKPDRCPENVYRDVIWKCWEKSPENRPTFAFLFHYFDDYFVASQHSYAPPAANLD